MTMKIKAALAAFAVALVALGADAFARELTDADKKLVRKVMAHLGAMAELLEEHTDEPDQALDRLESYIETNRDRIAALSRKIEAAEAELDDEAKEELQQYAQSRPEMKKFMNALMAFAMEHQGDDEVTERLREVLSGLEGLK